MGEQSLSPPMGYYQPRTIVLTGNIVIGASGAITSQSGMNASGATGVKNAAAGRYDMTLGRGYKRLMRATADVTSITAGSVGVVTDGNLAFVNGLLAANYAGTTPITTFTIQCLTSNGVATAANPKSGDIVTWQLEVSDS